MEIIFYFRISVILLLFINFMNLSPELCKILSNFLSSHQLLCTFVIKILGFNDFACLVFIHFLKFGFHFVINMCLNNVELSYRVYFAVMNWFSIFLNDIWHFFGNLLFSDVIMENFKDRLLSILVKKIFKIKVRWTWGFITSTTHFIWF